MNKMKLSIKRWKLVKRKKDSSRNSGGKNTITEMYNSLGAINNRFKQEKKKGSVFLMIRQLQLSSMRRNINKPQGYHQMYLIKGFSGGE